MEIPRTPNIGLALRRTAAAAVLLLGGNAVLFDDHGSEAQAAAVAFGGVEVEGITCPPITRGVNLLNTTPEVRFIESYNPSTGAVITGLTLGGGDPGKINVSEAAAGEDQPVSLRAKAQSGAIVGATQVIMDCLQNNPSTTTANSTSTSTSVSITTTTGNPNSSTSSTVGPNSSTTTTTANSAQPKTTILSITNPETTTTAPANPQARYIALTG
jgi:hypothetical protein